MSGHPGDAETAGSDCVQAPAPCDALGNACFCLTLDRAALQAQAEQELADAQLAAKVRQHWTHAFAEVPVFVDAAQLQRMEAVVRGIVSVVALPAWHAAALADAPEIARHDPRGAAGVFMGYDFHVAGDALGLIEINTNAGGALLNTLLARAQRACCPAMQAVGSASATDAAEAFENAIVAMFEQEWRAAEPGRSLRSVAIVDADPPGQFLHPEFVLFARLFARHGIEARIADPSELVFDAEGLRHGDLRIDLVYNRLTDFYLQQPASAALRQAWLHDAVVLTPHPQAHALYADKRRLAWLTDADLLQRWGVAPALQQLLLAAIPRTVAVTTDNAEDLWRERRRLFFKPVHGFGGRAAYRGDKLTKSAWAGVLAGDYVAQALVAPGQRPLGPEAGDRKLKFDLRNYVYRARVQWVAARLYQGQTTNFRTEGGGFAPVSPLAATARSPVAEEYASYVFLLDEAGAVRPLPHGLYVALARGEATSPPLAGRRLRVADWHMRLRAGAPADVVREWYGWARFDADGRFDPTWHGPGTAGRPQSHNIDPSALPSAEERSRMMALLRTDAP